jgi:hypothetical protein
MADRWRRLASQMPFMENIQSFEWADAGGTSPSSRFRCEAFSETFVEAEIAMFAPLPSRVSELAAGPS